MDSKRFIQISKYLSKHLRHTPDRIGLVLEDGGWVSVPNLLAAAAKDDFVISRDELLIVVTNNDKQRFTLELTTDRIRANQGHSIDIDLQLEQKTPPNVLYHGTSQPNMTAILEEGLRRMTRHHVHLSPDKATAMKVGQRHGRPVVLTVDAASMVRDGFTFFCSANGVWLVDHVPPKYLQLMEQD